MNGLTRAIFSPRAPRHVLLVLSAAWLTLGFGTTQLPWIGWPWLWACFYFAAAVACVWCSRSFENPIAGAVAGAASIVANFMRGAILIFAKVVGEPLARNWTLGQIVVGVMTSWTLAFVVAVLFFRRISPLAAVERVKS